MTEEKNENRTIEFSSNSNTSLQQSNAEINAIHNSDAYKLSTAYHLSEIKQNDKIIATATQVIWVGVVIICIGIVMAFCGRTTSAIVTAVSGLITEFISSIIFAFVTLSNKSKLLYFKQLSITEEGENHMKMVMSLDNKKAQEKLVEKLVTNYCDRRKEE